MAEPAWQLTFDEFTLYPLASSTGKDFMTWGLLKRALSVLLDFMLNNEVGTGMFKVWEGTRQVGSIVIGGPPYVPGQDEGSDVAGPSTFPGSLNAAAYDSDEAGPSTFPGSLDDTAGSSNAQGPSNATELGYDGREIG